MAAVIRSAFFSTADVRVYKAQGPFQGQEFACFLFGYAPGADFDAPPGSGRSLAGGLSSGVDPNGKVATSAGVI